MPDRRRPPDEPLRGRTVGHSTADLTAAMVLGNVVAGSVNANKRHWYKAGEALARGDRAWLARLVSRCEPPERFVPALERSVDDIKVVVQFTGRDGRPRRRPRAGVAFARAKPDSEVTA